MAYETNRFCWHGIVSTDPAKAAVFYAEALGWKSVTMPMGDDKATMFTANDVPIAHYMAPPMEGVPSHWNNYLRVDDVAATLKKAIAEGGKQIVPVTDIPVGRFAVVSTPSGAAISLFHEKDPEAKHHPGGVGSVHWTERHSKDIDKDLAWLESTFGFTTSQMPMPNGTYYILEHGGAPRGGAMQGMMEQAPAMWLTWIEVDDCDAAVGRIERLGGKALSPAMDMDGVGRMSVVQDNTGGVFGVIKPAPRS